MPLGISGLVPGWAYYGMLASVVLVAFYLYLFVRPQLVKRNLCLIVGAGAVLVSLLLIGIFATFIGVTRKGDPNWASILCGIIGSILNVIAFGSGAAACCGCIPVPGAREAAPTVMAEPAEPAEQEERSEGQV